LFTIPRVDDDMKIAVLLGADISENNGTTIRAKRIKKILEKEHEVLLLDSKKKDFSNVISQIIDDLIWNLKLLFLIPRKDINMVYLSSDFMGFFSIFLLSKLKRFKIVFEAHGILSEENINKKRNKLVIKATQIIEKLVITNSDYVVALSGQIYDFYKRYNSKIELVPAFINESIQYKPLDKNNNGFKSIGIIGPFDMPANKHYLEYIYTNIDKFRENLIFYVIGSCNSKIDNKKIKYTNYIESYSEYLSLISSLNLVLIPSKISTSGPLNKILEAMLCQTPVLTTSEGIVGFDYAKNQENILIFEEEEIIGQINENIFDGDLLEKISTNAAQIIKNHYSKEVNERKILNTVHSLS